MTRTTATAATTIRHAAVVQDGYGGVEVLRTDARPAPGWSGTDEVLVRVRAAGLDRGTGTS